MDYADAEVGQGFLDGIAKDNPKLAWFTLEYPYMEVTPNDSAIPGYALKSAIKVAMLGVNDDAPAAWNLHSKSYLRTNVVSGQPSCCSATSRNEVSARESCSAGE
jgi:hypothetical protein